MCKWVILNMLGGGSRGSLAHCLTFVFNTTIADQCWVHFRHSCCHLPFVLSRLCNPCFCELTVCTNTYFSVMLVTFYCTQNTVSRCSHLTPSQREGDGGCKGREKMCEIAGPESSGDSVAVLFRGIFFSLLHIVFTPSWAFTYFSSLQFELTFQVNCLLTSAAVYIFSTCNKWLKCHSWVAV